MNNPKGIAFSYSASEVLSTFRKFPATCLSLMTVWLYYTLLAFGVAQAQVVTADIVGSVTDSTGAVVPNAVVTVTNLGTNEVHTAKSSDAGEWIITLLPVGNYSVLIESTGFKKYAVASMALSGGDRARVTAKMEVGQITESVEVSTQPAALQTDSSTVGSTVTGSAIQDLPLNGRNFVSLATLAPGATAGGPNSMSGGTRPDDRRQSSSISVNGQNETLNNYLIDGMDNNERYIGTIGVRPSVDAMQEFRVETSLYTADVTRTAGGVINVITKAGTNGIHGTLFEFLRNDLVDASGNYNFSGGAPLRKGEYRQNQFGGSVGGPIRKDKTFYFGDFESLRIVQGAAFTDRIVPTEAQKAGDFSALATPIVDPTTGAPFAGNKIPTARFDAVIQKLLPLFPKATNQSVTAGVNYQNNVNRTQFQDTFDVRVDHHFSDSNILFGRYSYNDVTTFTPNAFPIVGGINPGGCNCATGSGQTLVPTGSFSGTAKQRAQNAQINYSHVFTPNLVFQTRLAFLRIALRSLPDNSLLAPNAATTLGIPGVNLNSTISAGMPQITLFPYASLGDQLFIPELVYDNTYQGNGDLHYTRGPQTLTVGFSYIRRHVYLNQSQQPRGFWAFNSTAPSGYTKGTGDTFADFLLDLPQTFTRGIQLVSFGSVGDEIGSFVQDDWRVTSKLTVNAGIRYDVFTPFSEQHGYEANWSIAQQQLLIANTNGVNNRANVPIDYGDFSPRIGFSANVAHGLVIRGGYGITYYHGLISQTPYLQNVPFTFSTSANCGVGQATACPTLVQGAPIPPTRVNLALAQNGSLSGTVTGLSSTLKTPYIEQWSLNIEKESHGNVFGVAYVGSAGHHNIVAINQNLGRNPAFSSLSANAVQRPLTAAKVFLNPTTNVNNSPNVNVSQNLGFNDYNALQLTMARRINHGLTVNANYSFAKSLGNAGSTQSVAGNGGLQWLDNFSHFDYGRTGLDVRHRVAFQLNYELPFASGITGVAGYAFKHWQINSVYQYSNGLPLTVLNPSNRLNIVGGGADRPNEASSVQYPHTLARWFNPASFSLNPIGFPGTEQAYSVQGTPFRSWDLSASKIFPLGERFRLQFRAEGFNILNMPNFLNPNGTIPGASFDPNNATTWGTLGTISGLAGAPRQFQFALKLEF